MDPPSLDDLRREIRGREGAEPRRRPPEDPQPPILDAHVHVDPEWVGVDGVDAAVARLLERMDATRVEEAVVIAGGLDDPATRNAHALRARELGGGRLHAVAAVSPRSRLEEDLAFAREHRDALVGLKLYPGYEPFAPDDGACDAVYEAAAELDLPVLVHTGDPADAAADLAATRPLRVDAAARRHRDVTFVLCHLGCPWFLEAAEVAYKNPNVCADLSGLVTPDTRWREATLRFMSERVHEALVYMNDPGRLIYGSDWPSGDMVGQRLLVESLPLDGEALEAVVEGNARRVYGLAKRRE